jgi:hypothetical protein
LANIFPTVVRSRSSDNTQPQNSKCSAIVCLCDTLSNIRIAIAIIVERFAIASRRPESLYSGVHWDLFGVASGGIVATATGSFGGNRAALASVATAAAAATTTATAKRCDVSSCRQTYVVDEENVDPRVDAAVEAGEKNC